MTAEERAPDPVKVVNRDDLAAALKALKGRRSYADLDAEAEHLAKRIPRPTAGGTTWTWERLSKSTVSDWVSGGGLPTRNKLLTYLMVCRVPPAEFEEWWSAVDRARAKRSTPIGTFDPIHLGVHRAIRGDTASPKDLPPYIERAHDLVLREMLTEPGGNRLIVLVGASSVGKTRTGYEAVSRVLPRHSVIVPAGARDLLEQLSKKQDELAGTVLWLDELQRYLQPPYGRDVAYAFRRVIIRPAKGSPVIALGSMWLMPYWLGMTREPRPGEEDHAVEVRSLLTDYARRVDVAEDFRNLTTEQLDKLEDVAKSDPRVATAVRTGGSDGRLTQILAGGPLVLQHYADLRQAEPLAHAVLTAAIDARRVGYQSPLPKPVLAAAVPGYLTHEQRVAGDAWLDKAIASASREVRGIRALAAGRHDATVGEAQAYALHDFVAQAAAVQRRRQRVPAALWTALARYPGDAADMTRVAASAHDRLLVTYALPLLEAAAARGDVLAAERLGDHLRDRGELKVACEVVVSAAAESLRISYESSELVTTSSTVDSDKRLHAVLLAHGVRGGLLACLAPYVEAGNSAAELRLRNLLNVLSDDEGATEWITSEGRALAAVKRFLAQQLARDNLKARVRMARSGACLTTEVVDTATQDNVGMAVGNDELKHRADSGDVLAAWRLADRLQRGGDAAGALQLLRSTMTSADEQGQLWMGEIEAGQGRLARLKARSADGDRAAELLLARYGDFTALWNRIDGGDPRAAAELAVIYLERGERLEARRTLTTAVKLFDDDECRDMLIDLLRGDGDTDALHQLAHPLADAAVTALLTQAEDIDGLIHEVELGLAPARALVGLVRRRRGAEAAARLLRHGLDAEHRSGKVG